MTSTTHVMRARPRLLTGLVVGLIAIAVLPIHDWLPRILVGWNITMWLYLLLVWPMMLRAPAQRVEALAKQEDESALSVLVLVCVAAIASLAAIIFELATAKSGGAATRTEHLALAGATLLGAWFMIPTIFTIHYARLYYGTPPGADTPLLFPDRKLAPDYWDFLYFSFTIAVASQTSDVALRSNAMRRAGLAQSILAFFFNASILALSINIAAGLLS